MVFVRTVFNGEAQGRKADRLQGLLGFVCRWLMRGGLQEQPRDWLSTCRMGSFMGC